MEPPPPHVSASTRNTQKFFVDVGIPYDDMINNAPPMVRDRAIYNKLLHSLRDNVETMLNNGFEFTKIETDYGVNYRGYMTIVEIDPDQRIRAILESYKNDQVRRKVST